MRGMFVALSIMGAMWAGGLVWSLFGGLVLVPPSAVTASAVRPSAPAALQPPAPAAPREASKPVAAATLPKPGATNLQPVAGHDKDTVTIGPGERYDLEFVADNPGAWVYHCHILSHVQNRGVEPGGMISLVTITE